MEYSTQKYKEAKQTQKKIYDLQQTENKRYSDKKDKIYFKYSKIERELNQKKYTEEREAEAEHEINAKHLIQQRAEADNKNQEFKRIISFMDILKSNEEFNKDKCKAYIYDYPRNEKGEVKKIFKNDCYQYPQKEKIYLNPIDILYEDENLILKVFIGDNRKPKNKKSLFVFGDSSLKSNHYESKVLNFPHEYGIDIHEENAPIRKLIKDLPTEKQLQKYYIKNKNKILKNFIQEHKKAVAEFEELQKNTNTKDWKILYLEEQKNKFERNHSGYEEDKEYIKIVAELKTLKGVY